MKEFIFSQQWYWLILIVLLSYGLGCVSAARIIARSKNKDITKEGSGNPGSMNMARTFGLKTGILTFSFDALKAVVPVLVCHLIYKNYVFEGTEILASDFVRYLAGICATLGHVYPAHRNFKGGKGIAPTLGMYWMGLVCDSLWFILIATLCFVLLFLFLYYSGIGSLVSLTAILLFGVLQSVVFILTYGVSGGLWGVLIYVNLLIVTAVDVWAHRENIKRLIKGEERRVDFRKKKKTDETEA